MEPRHQVSRTGIELIKRFEGYRPSAARLADGRWTLGYGHLRSAREGATASEADAEALLRYDLQAVEAALADVVFTPLTPNQYDALTAFAFNVGVEAFRRSNVLRRVNEGALLEAATALESWRRAEFEGEPLVVDALIRRRAAEKALFLTPTDGFVPAPSAVLKPELDYGALVTRGPSQAAAIVTPLNGDEAAPERLDAPEPLALDDEPSPAMAAAAAVSRRLEALFADEPNVAPPVPDDRLPELVVDPAQAMAAPAEATGDGGSAAPRKVVVLDTPAATAEQNGPGELRIARVAVDDYVGPVAAKKAEDSRWPFVILGLCGLVLFVISVSIVVNARRAGETDLFGPQSAVGTAFALVGIAGICIAIFYWLKTVERRPGRRDT